MYRKKHLSLLLLILSAALFFGCSKTEGKKQQVFFSDQSHYHLGIETGTIKTRAKVNFDEEGALHLLHEDPLSPLFGMEEVFSENCLKCYFDNLEFESPPSYDGIGIVYSVLKFIRENEAEDISKNQNEILYCYKTENENTKFEFLTIDKVPSKLSGTFNGKAFLFNFATGA